MRQRAARVVRPAAMFHLFRRDLLLAFVGPKAGVPGTTAIGSIVIFILPLVGKLHLIAYLIGGPQHNGLLGVEIQDCGLGRCIILFHDFVCEGII